MLKQWRVQSKIRLCICCICGVKNIFWLFAPRVLQLCFNKMSHILAKGGLVHLRYAGWLTVLGFNATLTVKVISWLSHTSTNTTFFPKPTTTFLTCSYRGERWKYAGKKVRLNRVSNLQPQGHESDTLTTESPGRGLSSHHVTQDP